MSSISQRAPLAEKVTEQLNKTVSHPETSVKNPTPRMEAPERVAQTGDT